MLFGFLPGKISPFRRKTMGALSSMSTAIAGLESNGEMLSIIADNIANANTTGFKAARAEFHSLLAEDLNSSASGAQLGKGAKVGNITPIFTQGNVTRTDRATDMAINGNGFFVLKSDVGATYTRDGSFRFDKGGWLVNTTGSKVQAYAATPEGKITGQLTDVRIPYAAVPAKATTRIEMFTNLDARIPPAQPIDLTRPDETSHYSTTSQIFDSVGNGHAVSVYFNRTSDATWEWHAMVDGADLAGGEKGKPGEIAQGSLTFDSNGRLQSVEQAIVNTNFANGAIPGQDLKFDFGDPIDDKGTGQKGTTQYGSKNVTFRNVQDGFSAGLLADTIIDGEGLITGVYSNGQNRVLGQIAMARFEATERLMKIGENQYKETADSGIPLIGKAKTSGRGVINPKYLEQSTVDIAKEFVDMIKAQRAFQANAKSITSANEMLEEVINIKNR